MNRALTALALVMAAPAFGQVYDVVQAPATAPLIDITQTGAALQLGDDNSVQVSLGFQFPFFDQTFDHAFVSSNGFLNFTTNFNGCCQGQPMAAGWTPRNGVYAFWTDLISQNNPYVSTVTAPDGLRIFVAEWLATKEYGTNNSQTFEIMLGEDGRIAIQYGSVGSISHQVSAGITGPTSADNYEFYYGTQTSGLSNSVYGLTPHVVPVAIDCTVTPNDPSCPPMAVAPVVAPVPTAQATQAVETVAEQTVTTTSVEQAVEQTVAAETTANATQEVAVVAVQPVAEQSGAATIEVAQVIDTPTQTASTASTAAAVAVSTATEKTAVAAARLTPDQLKALIAGGPPISLPGAASGATGNTSSLASSSTGMADSTQMSMQSGFDAGSQGGAFGQREGSQLAMSGMDAGMREVVLGGSPIFMPSSAVDPTAQGGRTTSLASQQSNIAALGIMPSPTKVSFDTSTNTTAPEQEAAMSALTAVPIGFNTYESAKLPDVRFYAPREIYRNKRPVDAYLVMYRLLMTGDRKWQAMTESQYGQ